MGIEEQAKISVIVPVYNAEEYLETCIQSICRQSIKELQIILVDDGSMDGSLSICRKLEESDHRIEVIHQENGGASSARNKGMHYASAEWIMFVDSDDWLEEGAIKTLYDETNRSDCDIIMGMIVNNYSFSEQDAAKMQRKINRYDLSEYRTAFQGGCIIEPQVFASVFPEQMKHLPFLGSPCAKIYRRKLLQEGQISFLENIHYGEDSIFNMNVLSKARSVCYISAPIYHYRMRPGSLSTGKIDEKYKQYHDYVRASEKCIRHLDIAKMEEFSTYRSLDLVQMIWELAEMYGMSSKNLKEIMNYARLLKKFADHPECKEAMLFLEIDQLPDKKHKVMVVILRRKMYAVSIGVCNMFYRIFKKKRRI